jgi:hypothetical protein
MKPGRSVMICPKCGREQPDGNIECAHCGVIFARIHPHVQSTPGTGTAGSLVHEIIRRTRDIILCVPPEGNRLYVAGRTIVYLAMVIWGLRLMTTTDRYGYIADSFLHMINLPFHEAGHVFFSPFGRFFHVLGGTLGQLLIPFIVICAFLFRRIHFGAAVGLWWLGENFLDIAPYIDDARTEQLILLGGVTGREVKGFHDWEVILTRLDWLRYDHQLARISFGTGIFVMVLSIIWGGYILRRQLKRSV